MVPSMCFFKRGLHLITKAFDHKQYVCIVAHAPGEPMLLMMPTPSKTRNEGESSAEHTQAKERLIWSFSEINMPFATIFV